MKRTIGVCTLEIAVTCTAVLKAGHQPPEARFSSAPEVAATGNHDATESSVWGEAPSTVGRTQTPPPNDSCADAISLFGEVQWLPFSTAQATDDGPVPSCQANTHRNVWYRWTAEVDGRAYVETCTSDFDTVVTAYEGSDCSDLVELACDDDSCDQGAQAVLEFDAIAGHTYLISVGGWNSNSGVGLLSVVMVQRLLGACCVDGDCVGTIPEETCSNQGGDWVFTGDCSAFACSPCPEDTLTISIDPDDRFAEISWDLVDKDSGGVIYSDGDYTIPGSHYHHVCLASDGCYEFTIRDSAGDGICCDNGWGQYALYLNDDEIKYGGEFGESETTLLGNGCDWPTGACCLAGNCLGTMTELQCSLQYGQYFPGEDCAAFDCPASMTDCSPTTLAAQPIPIEPWNIHIMTSDSSGSGVQLADHYSGADTTVYGLQWWGAWMNWSSEACVETDPAVKIRFYADDNGLPGAPACEYRTVPVVAPSGIILPDGTEILSFSVDLLVPPCNLENGWISIQGDGEVPDCRFHWATAVEGDGSSYRISPFPSTYPMDLSYCLDGGYEPRFGACCDEATGLCQDGVEIVNCLGRFVEGTLCTNLDPPCGQPVGACCYEDGTCEISSDAECTGNWLGEGGTCDECPCNVTCPSNAVSEIEACGEDFNGGCRLDPPMFNPVTPGVPVCGTVWADNNVRDTDWYEITTTENTAFTWSAAVESEEIGVLVGMVATEPIGTPDCSTADTFAWFTYAGSCEPVEATTVCLAPGSYWFYVGAPGNTGLPCGFNNDYVATLTTEPCEILGACCHHEGQECADIQETECDALGGVWWRYESCADHVCAVSCPEATVDIEVLTDIFPAQTSWQLTDALNGALLASGGPYEDPLSLYTQRVCVPANLCTTFTIYDEYGNGDCCNFGEGYYNVFYDGELIRNGGRFGKKESFDVGGSCPPPLGACCVAGECIGDSTEAECTAYHGNWAEASACGNGHDCAGEVDFRVVAPLINDQHFDSTCNKDDDCDLNPSEDVEYLITLPEAGTWTFSLCGSEPLFNNTISVGTTRCSRDIAFNDNFCFPHSQATATVPAGDYYVTIEGLTDMDCGPYFLNVVQRDQCEEACPAGATSEPEQVCEDEYVDTVNGGCSGFPFAFAPISPGETVCGSSGTYFANGELVADQDWYEIELPTAASVKWDVCATFDARAEILYVEEGICEIYYPVASTAGSANTASSASITVGPGKYWLTVAPEGDPWAGYTETPCGSTYVATLTVDSEPGTVFGDWDGDGDVDLNDFAAMPDCLMGPGTTPADEACGTFDFDQDGDVDMVDCALLELVIVP